MHLVLFYELIENFVAKREPFRVEHLKKPQEACDRGDLVLAGALAEPVDYAVLIFNGADPNVAERFDSCDPYVTNGLVKHWNVRKWTTVLGSGADHPVSSRCGGWKVNFRTSLRPICTEGKTVTCRVLPFRPRGHTWTYSRS